MRWSNLTNKKSISEKHSVENRVTELENIVAFQDDTIKQLNDVIAKQQRQIDQLASDLSELKQQFKVIMPAMVANANEETPPPHY